MNAIYLEPHMVPTTLRGGYSGKKIKAVVCTEMTIPSDAGVWSGGSRDHYSAVRFETGEHVTLAGQMAAPWAESRAERLVNITPGFAIVRHTMFCGKDLGLTFYVHPDNARKLLPPPPEALSEHERIVLDATCSYKSSYNGKDRYTMACEKTHYGEDGRYLGQKLIMTRSEWSSAKDSLIAKGLLNKAGAVTVAGRNARPSRY